MISLRKFNSLSGPITVFLVLLGSAASNPLNKTQTTEQSSDQDEAMIGMYNMFGGGNPKFTPEGDRLIEGDIVEETSIMKPKKGIRETNLLWPNGEVIYTFHESINPMEKSVIEAAMRHWEQHTCIRFRQRQASDFIFIRFRSDTQGCWSLVGRHAERIGQGQDVSIGLGCANLNVVVHEIGHVLGFYHEQSRSDRDNYIEIVWNNVISGYALQFRKENDNNYNIPYDLTSTMQYPQWAFSKEIFEKSTIVAKNPAYQRFLNKNYPLSFRDRQLANLMYSCTSNCLSSSCQNGGYARSTGSTYGQCSCDCPPNFSGSLCEAATREDYYESLPCGGVVTTEGQIETPGYPTRSAPGQSCMWDIQAPAGKKVIIKFDGFEFAPRFTKVGTKVINKCFNETVEIRLKSGNIYDGDVYCGQDLTPGTVLRSDGPRAVIVITANDKMVGKGLSARVKFVGLTQGEDFDLPETQKPTVVPTTSPAWTQTPITFTTVRPEVSTFPPVVSPQPPPSVVTSDSLLDLYDKESRKTLPPVFPRYS